MDSDIQVTTEYSPMEHVYLVLSSRSKPCPPLLEPASTLLPRILSACHIDCRDLVTAIKHTASVCEDPAVRSSAMRVLSALDRLGLHHESYC